MSTASKSHEDTVDEADDLRQSSQYLPGPLPDSFRDDLQRVLAKEEASRHAIIHLQHILAMHEGVKEASLDIDLRPGKALIDSIEQEKTTLRYFVGTGGDTGAGKSSLLNVLVNAKADIVPASQNGACTATVCCFSYPPADVKRQKFSAKVYMKPKTTVDKELVNFFEDLHEFEDRVRADGGEDSVTYAERDKFHDQLNLIHAWSGISEQRLRALGRSGSASEITTECLNAQEIFVLSKPTEALVISVSDDKESAFRTALKPFVGGRSVDALRWPLVEMVEIFVEADILQHGIVLVDLPGEMDALDARSQVARRFYSKLDRLIVVASGDRAANNKTAMDLIRDDQIVDMEAGGKLSTGNLGVVITKIDEMNWRSFIESEWPTGDVPAQVQNAADRLDELQAEIQGEDTEDEEKIEPKGIYPSLSFLGNDDCAFISDVSRHRRKLLEDEIKTLEAFCRRCCIDARSIDIKKQFQKRFERIRSTLRDGTDSLSASPLEVFSVSSHKYRNVLAGKRDETFPDALSTGITSLTDWIIRGSLPKRENHADSIIQRCQVIFDAVGSWATDDLDIDVMLSGAALSGLHSFLKNETKWLAENIMTSGRTYADELKSHWRAAKWSDTAKIDAVARGFVAHVDRYQKGTDGVKDKLHWSTYAACIRRSGGCYSTFKKPRREHYWQARTAMIMWVPHAASWNQLFGKPAQDRAVTLQRRIRDISEIYSARIKDSTQVPDDFKRAYSSCAYKIQNLAGEYSASLQQSVSKCRDAGDQIRIETRDWLNEYMREAYKEAQKATGPGKHAKQVKIMHDHAEQLQGHIFHKISERVDDEVRKRLLTLLHDVNGCGDELLAKIDKMTVDLTRRLSTPVAHQVKNTTTPELEKLKLASADEVAAWKAFWSALTRPAPQQELYAGGVLAEDNLETGSNSTPSPCNTSSSCTAIALEGFAKREEQSAAPLCSISLPAPGTEADAVTRSPPRTTSLCSRLHQKCSTVQESTSKEESMLKRKGGAESYTSHDNTETTEDEEAPFKRWCPWRIY